MLAPPTQPRSMRAEPVLERSPRFGSSQQFELDFYPKWLLLHSLGPFMGPHIDREYQDDDKRSIKDFRQAFLNAVAYLCDIERGGSTVTAAALQELKYSNTLWLAANEGIRGEVFAFVETTLLGQLMTLSTENRQVIEDSLLRSSVNLARQRMESYRERVVQLCSICRKALRHHDQDDTSAEEMRRWLRKYQYETDWKQLATTAYAARGPGGMLELLKSKGTISHDYTELAHYIGRLGAHQKAVCEIVVAWLKVPSISNIRMIRREAAAPVLPVELHFRDLEPYQLVKDICQRRSFHDGPVLLNSFISIDYSKNLRSKMSRSTRILTRVHAELLLVDRFGRSKFKFVDDDKFVGCSKPACLFCHSWMSLHHNGFVPPSTHNKVVLGCRGPDGDSDRDLNGNGARILRNMRQKLVQVVEEKIISALANSGGGQNMLTWRHCSTDGTSRAPSCL